MQYRVPMMAGSAASLHSPHTVRGYCALCVAHCATVATVEDGRVTRLDPDPDHPHGGVLCLKGKAAPELVYHSDRLNYPLKRTRPKGDPDPGWRRISWEEALSGITGRLRAICERYGPRAIALAKGTAAGTSVDDSQRWLNRFMNALGSPNSVSTIHVCNWHKDHGLTYTFGEELPLPDLASSRSFLLWGHNPSSTSLILAHDLVAARAKGMKLVAVDPRKVGLPAQADILLQVRPGADGALALALVHALLEEGWYDAEFLRRWTNGPFLLRGDTGKLLTESDLTSSGSRERYVVWDENSAQPAIYDSTSVSFDRDNIRPALFGERAVQTRQGEIRSHTVLDALAKLASRYSPERSQPITWVAAKEVWHAAQILSHNRPASMYVWNGVGQNTNATQTNRAIAILYALLGDFDRQGGNVIFPAVPVNSVEGRELLPEQRAAERLGLRERPLGPPGNPGNCTAYDVFTAILEGRPYPVKALLNFGSNTVMSSGDSRRAREAFCAVELAVATELFMTPTAQLCDYVLPAASFLEMANLKTGFRHRPEGRVHVQYRPAVIEPLGERRSDTWIIFELAARSGFAERFWDGDIEAAYAYELAPSGMSLEQLKAAPGGRTLAAATRYQKHAQAQNGKPRGFATPSRKVEIYSQTFADHGYPPLPEYEEPAMSPVSRPDLAADYPLILTSAKFTTFIHSQQRSLPSLRKASPEPTAEMHPKTAEQFGIENKQWMVIETPKGAIRVLAHVTERIIPGVVCTEHGWWQDCKELGLPGYDPYAKTGANPSALIGTELADPISGSLPHRSYLCRVKAAG